MHSIRAPLKHVEMRPHAVKRNILAPESGGENHSLVAVNISMCAERGKSEEGVAVICIAGGQGRGGAEKVQPRAA